jgi:carbonic anhydrase
MDRRLNSYLDENYNDGNTLFLRNAGANAHCLLQSISEAVSNEIVDSIVILGHTDCGAMKVVFDALANNNMSYSADITNKVIHPFYDYDYLKDAGAKLNGLGASERKEAEAEIRRDLEIKNVEMQLSFLKELTKSFPNINITGSIIDLSKINVPKDNPQHKYSVIFTRECLSKFSDMCNLAHTNPFDTYILMASTIKEALVDLEVAVGLFHIRDIKFVVPEKSMSELISSDLDWIKNAANGFLKDAHISVEHA